MPEAIASAFLGAFSNLFVAFITPLLETAKVLITYNIDPNNYAQYWQAIVVVLSAFYLLLFVIVGLKFLLGSYSPEQRTEAKEWLKNAIFLLVLINASLLIYSLLLQLSQGIAVTLWNNGLEEFFRFENASAIDLLWLIIIAIALFLALLSLFFRHLIVIVGVMLFPIGLFLYFIEPLRGYGSGILNVLGAGVFMQVLDVIILIGVSLLGKEFSFLQGMTGLSLTVGFLFIALANLALISFALKKAVSAVGVKVSIRQTVQHISKGLVNRESALN